MAIGESSAASTAATAAQHCQEGIMNVVNSTTNRSSGKIGPPRRSGSTNSASSFKLKRRGSLNGSSVHSTATHKSGSEETTPANSNSSAGWSLVDYRKRHADLTAQALKRLKNLVGTRRSVKSFDESGFLVAQFSFSSYSSQHSHATLNEVSNHTSTANNNNRGSLSSSASSFCDPDYIALSNNSQHSQTSLYSLSNSNPHQPTPLSSTNNNKRSSSIMSDTSGQSMNSGSEHSIHLGQIFQSANKKNGTSPKPPSAKEKPQKITFETIAVNLSGDQRIEFLLRNPIFVKPEQQQQQQEDSNANNQSNSNTTTTNNNNGKLPSILEDASGTSYSASSASGTGSGFSLSSSNNNNNNAINGFGGTKRHKGKYLRRPIKCYLPKDRFQLPKMEAIQASLQVSTSTLGSGTSHRKSNNNNNNNMFIFGSHHGGHQQSHRSLHAIEEASECASITSSNTASFMNGKNNASSSRSKHNRSTHSLGSFLMKSSHHKSTQPHPFHGSQTSSLSSFAMDSLEGEDEEEEDNCSNNNAGDPNPPYNEPIPEETSLDNDSTDDNATFAAESVATDGSSIATDTDAESNAASSVGGSTVADSVAAVVPDPIPVASSITTRRMMPNNMLVPDDTETETEEAETVTEVGNESFAEASHTAELHESEEMESEDESQQHYGEAYEIEAHANTDAEETDAFVSEAEDIDTETEAEEDGTEAAHLEDEEEDSEVDEFEEDMTEMDAAGHDRDPRHNSGSMCNSNRSAGMNNSSNSGLGNSEVSGTSVGLESVITETGGYGDVSESAYGESFSETCHSETSSVMPAIALPRNYYQNQHQGDAYEDETESEATADARDILMVMNGSLDIPDLTEIREGSDANILYHHDTSNENVVTEAVEEAPPEEKEEVTAHGKEEPEAEATDGEESMMTDGTEGSDNRHHYGLSVYLSSHSRPEASSFTKRGKRLSPDSKCSDSAQNTFATEDVTSISDSRFSQSILIDESTQTHRTNSTNVTTRSTATNRTTATTRTSSSLGTYTTNRTANSAPGYLYANNRDDDSISSRRSSDNFNESKASIRLDDLSRQSKASSAPLEGYNMRSRNASSQIMYESGGESTCCEESDIDDATVGSSSRDFTRRRSRKHRHGSQRRSGVSASKSAIIPRSNTPQGLLMRTRSGELGPRMMPSGSTRSSRTANSSSASDGRPRMPPRRSSRRQESHSSLGSKKPSFASLGASSVSNELNQSSSQRHSRRNHLARKESLRSAVSSAPSQGGLSLDSSVADLSVRSRSIRRTKSGHRDSFMGGSRIKKWNSSSAKQSTANGGLSLLERHLSQESAKAANDKKSNKGRLPPRRRSSAFESLDQLHLLQQSMASIKGPPSAKARNHT